MVLPWHSVESDKYAKFQHDVTIFSDSANDLACGLLGYGDLNYVSQARDIYIQCLGGIYYAPLFYAAIGSQ